MKKDFQDRIDEYLLGRMPDEEKAQFEAEVSQDESKRDQLEFTRNVKGAISSREDKLARMKMMQRMYDRKRRQAAASMRPTGTDDSSCAPAPRYAKKRPSRRIWWWASGIAAVLVVGLFVGNPLGSDKISTPPGSSSSFKRQPIFKGQPTTKRQPNEKIRGDENDVFDMETPILNGSIKNDTIPPRDTVTVVKERIEETNE